MKLLLIPAVVLVLSGCTSAGSPPPGESVNNQACEVGEVWVCRKPMTAAKDEPSSACMCQRKVEIDEF